MSPGRRAMASTGRSPRKASPAPARGSRKTRGSSRSRSPAARRSSAPRRNASSDAGSQHRDKSVARRGSPRRASPRRSTRRSPRRTPRRSPRRSPRRKRSPTPLGSRSRKRSEGRRGCSRGARTPPGDRSSRARDRDNRGNNNEYNRGSSYHYNNNFYHHHGGKGGGYHHKDGGYGKKGKGYTDKSSGGGGKSSFFHGDRSEEIKVEVENVPESFTWRESRDLGNDMLNSNGISSGGKDGGKDLPLDPENSLVKHAATYTKDDNLHCCRLAFQNLEEAQKAVSRLDNMKLLGKTLKATITDGKEVYYQYHRPHHFKNFDKDYNNNSNYGGTKGGYNNKYYNNYKGSKGGYTKHGKNPIQIVEDDGPESGEKNVEDDPIPDSDAGDGHQPIPEDGPLKDAAAPADNDENLVKDENQMVVEEKVVETIEQK